MANARTPFPSKPPAHLLRCAMLAQIVGIVVLSITLLTTNPLVSVVAIPLGAALIVLGALVWAWSVFWAR